jgi:hypothetical protein
MRELAPAYFAEQANALAAEAARYGVTLTFTQATQPAALGGVPWPTVTRYAGAGGEYIEKVWLRFGDDAEETEYLRADRIRFDAACGYQSDVPVPINLNDPAVQKRLAAQWGYVPAALGGVPQGWLLSDEALEIGRRAVEDALVEMRDSRISELGRGNGLVIREKDGTASSIIRFGPETALHIGIKAMLSAAPAQDAPSALEKLASVRAAVQTYYAALDRRQHGGVAQDAALRAIEQALGMRWVQGATLKGGESEGEAAR